MLTGLQKLKLPRLFALHDLNSDGVINRADFEEYAARTAATRGWEADSVEANELRARFLAFWTGIEHIAENRDSANVTLAEWLDYWDRVLNTPDLFDEIAAPLARTIFLMLDHDGDGFIRLTEYTQSFRLGGLDAADAKAAFARLDWNGDGRISQEEFLALTDDFFKSDDPAARGNALFGIVHSAEAIV